MERKKENPILREAQILAFIKTSTKNAHGEFTVVDTERYWFHKCSQPRHFLTYPSPYSSIQEKVTTLIKDRVVLGSRCQNCHQEIELGFKLTPEILAKIPQAPKALQISSPARL